MLAEAQAESERLLTEATEVNDQAQARADALLAERTAEAEAASASPAGADRAAGGRRPRQGAGRRRGADRAGPGRGPGHGGGGPGAAGPGAGRPVPPPQGAPRPDRAAPGRARAAGRDHHRRAPRRSTPSPRTCSTPRTRPGWPPRWPAGRRPTGPTRGRPRSWPPRCWPRRPPTPRPLADGPRPGEPARRPDGDGDGGRADAVAAPPVEQVDALFAKLRAAQGDEAPDPGRRATGPRPTLRRRGPGRRGAPEPAEAAADGAADAAARRRPTAADEGPPEARHPLAVQRDELLAPIVTGLSRRLKRSLQDNQNDLLDRLRAKGTTWSTDLLPDETEQVDSFATVGAALPRGGGRRRRRRWSGTRRSGPSADALLGDRPRAGRGASSARCAAAWPTARASRRPRSRWSPSTSARPSGSGRASASSGLAGDHVVAAFSLGTLAVAGKGGTLEWVAVAAAGRVAVPRLRGQRPQRGPGGRRGVPHRAPAPAGPPGLSMPARSRHPLGCCRAHSE